MPAVVPFSDHALFADNVDVVFHTARATGRQRMAGDERPTRADSRTRGKRRFIISIIILSLHRYGRVGITDGTHTTVKLPK